MTNKRKYVGRRLGTAMLVLISPAVLLFLRGPEPGTTSHSPLAWVPCGASGQPLPNGGHCLADVIKNQTAISTASFTISAQ